MSDLFPGMDPYLENPGEWRDFHHTFIGSWREAIADVLPESYHARVDETVQLMQMSEDTIKTIYPDVAVSQGRRRSGKMGKRDGKAAAVLEPVVIPHEIVEVIHQGRIKIVRRLGDSLVAVLGLLSPWNKRGEGFTDFCAKRMALLQKKVHLVELDLLLGGKHLPLAEPLPPGDYYLMVSRSDRRPQCEVYAWTLRQSLPRMPIPLKPPDSDVYVDLPAVFRQAYERGRYASSVRYDRPPRAPMSKEDRTWAMRQAARKRNGP